MFIGSVRVHTGLRIAAASREQGYILVTLTLFVALLAVAAMAIAPSITFQIRRDQEEETDSPRRAVLAGHSEIFQEIWTLPDQPQRSGKHQQPPLPAQALQGSNHRERFQTASLQRSANDEHGGGDRGGNTGFRDGRAMESQGTSNTSLAGLQPGNAGNTESNRTGQPGQNRRG